MIYRESILPDVVVTLSSIVNKARVIVSVIIADLESYIGEKV